MSDLITPADRIALGVLTAQQAAALVDCEPEQLARRGVPCVKLGRSRVYPRDALIAWLTAQAVAQPEADTPAPVAVSSPARAPKRRARPLPVLPSLT